MGNLVIYHDNCSDGFGAALAAWRKFGDSGARYLPFDYERDPEQIKVHPTDTVYLVDFCFDSLTDLQKLSAKCKNVVVLDHHKTAKDQLLGVPRPDSFEAVKDYEGLSAWFDMTQSGAVIAWHFFHSDLPVPELFQYIEDRDLWKWELPQSREVSLAIQTLPKNFRVWDSYVNGSGFPRLMQAGADMKSYQDQLINTQIKNCAIPCVYGGGNEAVKAIVINISSYEILSETCERILMLNPQAEFVCAYFHMNGKHTHWIRASMRATGRSYDLTKIALEWGGGGHEVAAAFTCISHQFMGIFHSYNSWKMNYEQ